MNSVVLSAPSQRPEIEVSSKPVRRRYTAEYKERILRESAVCEGTKGALSALLRREGLYSSHLAQWREEARRGLANRPRGPKPSADPACKKIAQLEAELAQMRTRAERAEALVELQKKVSQLLGLVGPSGGRS
jgi:transposase-like protein